MAPHTCTVLPLGLTGGGSWGLALDLHPDDSFLCTADPGWVTGTSYGLIAPPTSGITSIVDEGEFDADRRRPQGPRPTGGTLSGVRIRFTPHRPRDPVIL